MLVDLRFSTRLFFVRKERPRLLLPLRPDYTQLVDGEGRLAAARGDFAQLSVFAADSRSPLRGGGAQRPQPDGCL